MGRKCLNCLHVSSWNTYVLFKFYVGWKTVHYKNWGKTSPVVQRLGIHLPMQGTWVQFLVWEDPRCCRSTKPLHHNYWGLKPESLCSTRKTLQWETQTPQRTVVPAHGNKRTPEHSNKDTVKPKMNTFASVTDLCRCMEKTTTTL